MVGLQSLYHWALRQAERPHAPWLMFFIALIEPCLIPIPPDALLIPMILARRDKAFKLALVCTLGSITGCLIGYGIGALGMATIGQWIVDTYHLEDALEHFRHGFRQWGTGIIILKGSIPVIPVPFLLVTVVSGILQFSMWKFLGAVVIARGTRFFLEAWLLYRYGAPIKVFIEKYLTWIFVAVLAVLGFAFWLVSG